MTVHALLQALLEQWAAFLVAASAVVAGAVKLAEASAGFARLLGPLGGLIRGRADRKRQRLRDERSARREGEAADIVDLRRQVDALEERLKLVDLLTGYLAYDAEWHTRAEIRSAGASVDLGEHLSFDDWCTRFGPLRVYQGAYSDPLPDTAHPPTN